jgi:hypothetical protein
LYLFIAGFPARVTLKDSPSVLVLIKDISPLAGMNTSTCLEGLQGSIKTIFVSLEYKHHREGSNASRRPLDDVFVLLATSSKKIRHKDASGVFCPVVVVDTIGMVCILASSTVVVDGSDVIMLSKEATRIPGFTSSSVKV